MTEDDKVLVARLREQADEWFEMCDDIHEPLGEAADRIEALIAENERLTYNGIHSCHDQCERPLCVAQRENERLQAQYDEMGNHMLKHIGKAAEEIVRLELENDGLKAENEKLREALELADAALKGANMNMNVVERKISAALGKKK